MESLNGGSAVRLHPLVWDFSQRLLATKKQRALKREAATRVKMAYGDPLRLESEYLARSIHQVIDDVEVAIGWCGGAGRALSELELLGELLGEEKRLSDSGLGDPDQELAREIRGVEAPRSLLQQLHYHAVIKGRGGLAAKFLDAGQRRGVAFFKVRGMCPTRECLPEGDPGESCEVRAVGTSEDGRRALSVTWDNKLVLWDAEKIQSVWIVGPRNRCWIAAATMSADGKRAVTGSRDANLVLWDMDRGTPLRIFKGHRGVVSAVDFSRDGRRVLSGSWDGRIILWDVESGRPQRMIEGRSGVVNAVSLSADGRRILSGCSDNTLTLWDIDSGRAIQSFGGHSDEVTAVCLSADGRGGLSGSEDGTVILWEFQHARAIRTLVGHTDGVRGVRLTDDRRRAVSVSRDGRIILWDLNAGIPSSCLQLQDPLLCVSLAGNRTILGDATGVVYFLEIIGNYGTRSSRLAN
jgi:WD40 repeat protein